MKNLSFVQLKIKYRGSILGFLWSLVNPLSMIVIYMIAFKHIMRIGASEGNYLFCLVTGVLPWIFVANSLISSSTAIISNHSLLKKVYFPREVFPLSIVFFHFIQFLLSQIVFLPFFLYWSIKAGTLGPVNLMYFVILLFLIVFVVGMTFLISSLTVFYRDIQHFSEVGVQMFFWLTPIVYPLSIVPDWFRNYFYFNPFTCFFDALYWAVYRGEMPNVKLIGVMSFWSLLAFFLGIIMFRRLEPRFVDEL
jgi:ABC-2 type transport system permease protein